MVERVLGRLVIIILESLSPPGTPLRDNQIVKKKRERGTCMVYELRQYDTTLLTFRIEKKSKEKLFILLNGLRRINAIYCQLAWIRLRRELENG